MPRISNIEALARITSRMPMNAPSKGGQEQESLTFLAAHGDASETLYEFTKGKLRILSPAFDELPPILATYEVEGGEMPQEVEEWLMDYARELEQLESGMASPIESNEAEATADGDMIGPLTLCKWNQGNPYNRNIVNGCYTGCGATSISILLKHWADLGYRMGLPATKTYTTKTNKIIVPALKGVSSFDYDNMPVGKPKTEREIAAVATIMQHVGYALQSDYKTTGTASNLTSVVNVLKNDLKMGSIKTIYATNGAKEFEEALKAEIKAARPVFLGGWNSSNSGGHWFIVDGYDPITNFFHINWGFGGSYNGWFALTALKVQDYNFSCYKKAVIGIMPSCIKGDVNGDGCVSVSDVMAIQQMILNHRYSEAADVNQDGVVDVVDAMKIVQHILKGGTL